MSVFKQMQWNSGHNFIRKVSVLIKSILETEIMVQQKSEQLDVARGMSSIHTWMKYCASCPGLCNSYLLLIHICI